MNKKILLGAAISLASLQVTALPFAPTDARSMAMGGTGVSSAEVASTVQFNPALLANTREDDHFGLNIPIGGSFSDEDDFIDEVDDFDTESPLATPGSGNTNIDLLSDTLDIASDPTNGIEGLADAAQNVADVIAAFDGINDSNELTAASNTLDGKIAGLRGTVISTDDDPNTPPDSDLVLYSDAVATDLDDLNNRALRLNLGGSIAVAIPSKKFSMALSTNLQGVFSGKILVPQSDTDQLRNYTSATDAYLTNVVGLTSATTAVATAQTALEGNPADTTLQNNLATAVTNLNTAQLAVSGFDYGGTSTIADDGEAIIFEDGELIAGDAQLNSTVHMIGAGIADVGLTASRVFNIAGNDIAIGITPKLQMVTVFDYIFELDGQDENGNDVEFDEEAVSDNTEEYSTFNMDIGAAYQFGAEKQFQAGLVIKNLMSKDFDSSNGETISISPMIRAGVSHKTDWTKVAFDLDLTENDPIAFEDATQYASLGAELNLLRILQLRAGYRANLAASDQDVVTAGIGFSPLAIHMNLGLMANTSDPEKEAGIAFEFGVEF